MNSRELLNLENAERDPVLLCTLSFVFPVSLFVSAWFLLCATWHPCLGRLLSLLPFHTYSSSCCSAAQPGWCWVAHELTVELIRLRSYCRRKEWGLL